MSDPLFKWESQKELGRLLAEVEVILTPIREIPYLDVYTRAHALMASDNEADKAIGQLVHNACYFLELLERGL